MTNNELQVLRNMINKESGIIKFIIIDAISETFEGPTEEERDFLIEVILDFWRFDDLGKSIYTIVDALKYYMDEHRLNVCALENKKHDENLTNRDIFNDISSWLYC